MPQTRKIAGPERGLGHQHLDQRRRHEDDADATLEFFQDSRSIRLCKHHVTTAGTEYRQHIVRAAVRERSDSEIDVRGCELVEAAQRADRGSHTALALYYALWHARGAAGELDR